MPIETSQDGAVRTLVLARPEKLNAFDARLLDDFLHALEDAAAAPDTNVVIITGAGRAFSAGADLEEVAKLHERQADAPPPDGPDRREVFDGVIALLAAFPKPLLMAVNGLGVGFGTTMLTFADLVFVSTEARLRCPFTLLGVPPEAASSDRLARVVGRQNAAWLLLSSEWITAEEAHAMGLAWKLCDPDELLAVAREHAQLLADRSATGLRLVKQALNAPLIDRTTAAHELEMELFGQVGSGEPAP